MGGQGRSSLVSALEEVTLAELLRRTKRFHGALFLGVVAAVAALVLLGTRLESPVARGRQRTSVSHTAAATSGPAGGGAASGSATVPVVLASAVVPRPTMTDVVAPPAATGEQAAGSAETTAPPAAPTAPKVDPTTLILDQVAPGLSTVVNALAVIAPVNDALPALPVPSPVAVPRLPAPADPLLLALVPATGQLCGAIATANIALAFLRLPIPITPQHIGVAFAEFYGLCGTLTPSG
jgi:hypothetical protein